MTLNSSLSVFSAVTVGYIRYQHTVLLKLYDSKVESFFSLDSNFYIKKPFNREKMHSGLFLPLAITGIDVNDIKNTLVVHCNSLRDS